MSIRLKRLITARAFDVAGTVAFGEKRPEFLSLVRLAIDLGRPIIGQDVTRELLGNLSETFGWRALERCARLLLLTKATDAGYVPTEIGATSLDQELVPVPQEGVFRFWGLNDPLFPLPIIQVDPLETLRAEQERNELKRQDPKKDGDRKQGERTPSALRDAKGVLFDQALGDQMVRIDQLADRGLWTLEADLAAELRWIEGDTPMMVVTGSIPDSGKKQERRLDWPQDLPEQLSGYDYERVWSTLAAQALDVSESEVQLWTQRYGGRCILVPFDGLTPAELRTFRTRLEIDSPEIDGVGGFEPTTLEDVRLVPDCEATAQSWALWLQMDRVQTWQTPDSLRRDAAEIAELFPYHNPRLLEPYELIQQVRQEHPAPRSWFYLAPYDLGLWP